MPGLDVVLLLALLNAIAMALHALTGFGAASILAPVLPLSVAHGTAVVTILALGVVINLLVTIGAPPAEGPPIVRRLLPALIAGAPIGVFLALNLPERVLQLTIAVIVLSGVAIQLRPTRPGRSPVPAAAGISPWLPGMSSGAFAASVGLGAPPIVLWLDARGASLVVRRYAVARVFVVPNLVAIAIFLAADARVGIDGLILAAALLPTTLIGYLAGQKALSTMSLGAYRIVALVMVTGGAVVALATGLWPS